METFVLKQSVFTAKNGFETKRGARGFAAARVEVMTEVFAGFGELAFGLGFRPFEWQ